MFEASLLHIIGRSVYDCSVYGVHHFLVHFRSPVLFCVCFVAAMLQCTLHVSLLRMGAVNLAYGKLVTMKSCDELTWTCKDIMFKIVLFLWLLRECKCVCLQVTDLKFP